MKRLLLAAVLLAPLVGCAEKPRAVETVVHPESVIEFEYDIVKIEGNEFYGNNPVDGTGIYFTSDTLAETPDLEVGDKIKATFDSEDAVEGLVAVEKIGGTK